MTTRAFFKVCLVLIFLNTVVEKHTLSPEITILYQFHDQKALFKVPKICNINFWIENDPTPPLALFQKFIRFGSGILPFVLHQSFSDQGRSLFWQIMVETFD